MRPVRLAKVEANKIIADVAAHAAELSRLLEMSRKKLESDRDKRTQKVASDEARVAARLAELERAKQEAEAARTSLRSARLSLVGKLAHLEAGIAEAIAIDQSRLREGVNEFNMDSGCVASADARA